MSCYDPKLLIDLGVNVETGKHDYRYAGDWSDDIESQWLCNNYDEQSRFVKIPCGKCQGCMYDRARLWSYRIMMERLYHDESWFVTLTYDDDHCPRSDNGAYTLKLDDLQRYLKRLRKVQYNDYGVRIRFFACGEYGSQTFRPHYHLILFGCHLPDLLPWRASGLGNMLYRSEFMEHVWPYGHVEIGEVTQASAAYVARYCTKKLGGNKSVYTELGVDPEFVTMSRRPAIGAKYYEDHKDHIFEYQRIDLPSEHGGIVSGVPRIFDRYFDRDGFDIDAVKQHRIDQAMIDHFMRMYQSDLSYREQLSIQQRQFSNRTKIFERSFDGHEA